MELQLRHLRYFVTLAEELHFGRAADRLHIAQPPLSQQIRQLEEYLGVRLLERTRRKVELTDAGRVFLEESRRTLAQAQMAVQAVQQASRGEMGRLEIGFAPSAPFNILPGILKLHRERYPKVTLALHEMTTTEQVTALHEGRVDVGFLRLPVDDQTLAVEVILREPLVVALPESHRLAPRARVSLKQLATEPFLMFPRNAGPGLYDQILSLCIQAGFSPKVTQEASQMPTIIGLVGAGFGVALVPASVQNIHGSNVVFRPLQNSALVDMGIATRREEPSPALKTFLHVAREVCRDIA